MSRSFPELPDRVDLDQLRRQAKELRDAARRDEPTAVERIARHARSVAAPGALSLAVAQLVIARELGFASWAKLKASVESRAVASDRASLLLAASVDGYTGRARRLLGADPTVGRFDIRTAAVVGDTAWVARLLEADPSAATGVDRERGWPPLLYVCYSHWHRVEPARARKMATVARRLLDAGASPDTNNGARPHHGYRSALHGSVTVNNPEVTRLLLQRGARPDDGESLYQAAEHCDHQCLQLLLAHGATVAGTWAVDVAVGADDAAGVRLLLDAAAQQIPDQVATIATGLLARASASGTAPVMQALLDAGADPTKLVAETGDPDHATPDGLSPLRLAIRADNEQTASLLHARGLADDATDIDRFLGACARGERATAERLLAAHPRLRDQLSDRDQAAIVDVAGSGSAAAAVRLMLELGFSPHARNNLGETPLHLAAAAGDPDTVRLLLDHGAELDARDANYHGTPLGYATVSSGEPRRSDNDWPATVRLLLDAGGDRTGVWVPDMPPSEDVAEVLHNYGITGNDKDDIPPQATIGEVS
jgi:ankyrin repeat protein